MPSQNASRFAFVVPVVHPEGSKVSDYAVVERALKETLRSYTSQQDRDVVVIVVCHRVPAWAAEFAGRVRFVRIGAHPCFAANRNDVEIDKGMKYVLGSLIALAGGADFVMPADGDDFVRTDLAGLVRARERELGGHDGFIVREGYNAVVAVAPEGLRILQVLRVQDFDRTCGTCRIFTRASLTRAIEKLDPGILAWSDRLAVAPDGTVVPDPALLDHIWEITAPVAGDPWGTIRLLGRHLRQGRAFDFVPLSEPLAGKACGHGNHDGPSRGGIRWSGVRGCADGADFMARFGLAGGDIVLDGFHAGLRLRGAGFGALNRLRRLARLDFGYERKHALELKPGE